MIVWILALGLLAGSSGQPSVSVREKLTPAQVNAKKVAGHEWWYYHKLGSDRWTPEYHPERKQLGVTILYFMKKKEKGEFNLYLTRSHRYYHRLESLPKSCYVVFRYSDKPQQQETQYSAAYLILVKWAPVLRGGKPGRWKAIKP